MRVTSTLLCVLMTGCGAVAGPNLEPVAGDPHKIYLDGKAPFTIPEQMPRERYGCADRPMLCSKMATRWQCQCPP